MRRRYFVTAGTAVGLTILAGCSSPLDEPDEPGEDDSEVDEPDVSNGAPGAVDASVEPSASEITYGDEYTLTVTMRNTGSDTEFFSGQFVVRMEGETWRNRVSTGLIQIPPDEVREETYTVAPPGVGELEFGFMEFMGEVLDQWSLSVASPRSAFGDANSFYDGVAVTADVELRDAMEMEVTGDQGTATRSITAPAATQWAVLSVRIENTTNDVVNWGFSSRFFLRSNGIQQEGYTSLNWYDDEFEDQLRRDERERVEMGRQPGYYQRPTQLSPGGIAEGWLLFTVPEDASIGALDALLTRREQSAWSDVPLFWESQ